MKNHAKLLVSLALMALAPLTSQAQGVNDAFYIYQNDGHFNGFFYDQVQKINYSKLDTLGVEHSDYVSQEIVTADSTYRIMLAAIDSVTFVQPEIIENPQMRNVQKEGISNYLLSKEDLVLTFSKMMPANLIPKVDDVLADFSTNDSGYSGKVVSVDTSGSNIVVQLKDIESIHDLYQQYISIEEYAKDGKGNNIGRRVAGMPELNTGIYAPRRSSDKFDFNIFNFALSGHLPIYTSSGGDVNISIDADIASAATLKVVTKFPMFGKDYVGFTLVLDNSVGIGFTVDGKLHDAYPAGLTQYLGKLPIPAAAPLFVLDFGPDGFVKAEAHAKFNVSFPAFKGKLWYTLEFDDWSPSINFGHGTPPGEEEAAEEPKDDPVSVSLEFNGTLQGGVKFPLNIFTNKLLEKLVKTEVGTTIYLGPKFTGAINLSFSQIVQDEMSAYNLLKDSKLSMSYLNADYESKATIKTLFTDEREWTLADGSINLLGEIAVYAVPEFELGDILQERDALRQRTNVSVPITPSRNILWPVQVGVGLFKDNVLCNTSFDVRDAEVSDKQMPAYSAFSGLWRKSKNAAAQFSVSEGGNFEARPMFRFNGIWNEFPASPAKKVFIEGPYIEYTSSNDTIMPTLGGDVKIGLSTSCTDIKEAEYGKSGDGVYYFNVAANDNSCTISANALHGIGYRYMSLTLCGYYKEKTGSKTYYQAPQPIYIKQVGDRMYNTAGVTDHEPSSWNISDPLPVTTSVSQDTLLVITGHRDAELEDGMLLPTNGYDIQLSINSSLKNNRGIVNGKASRISNWKSASDNIWIRTVIETTLQNCTIVGKPNSEDRVDIFAFEDGTYTTTIHKTYVKWNEAAQANIIVEEEDETLTQSTHGTQSMVSLNFKE